MNNVISDKFIVSGRVQGVGFRYHTALQASKLSVLGYAKNLPSGEVEVLAVGQSEHVEQLSIWLQQGPKTARVEQVMRSQVTIDSVPSDFQIL
ncbi:acylphosphatase [Vibrio metschnikovii]|uniref:acylphosphatase n=1 Tax=Vibrio metschnikovii TaxID=28172 RepID=UPI001C2F6A41|nr:acylphosphatase [Vibrio metschnikovii]